MNKTSQSNLYIHRRIRPFPCAICHKKVKVIEYESLFSA